ncbi:fused response regulator/phosphatase [Estrella lausannensis]|uniref:Signal transduction response regulator n=1 Tax=Estrella lausannensis TaxID=483423 RepID=A0A0H5DPK1_9BACT|nr:fused response regulator/phosphatase [Estrella lausannensis]CRX38382.1 Signal transduction response regulator [Estrella lausannensis]
MSMILDRDRSTLEYLNQHPVSVLLVDDQRIISEAIKRCLVTEQDIVFYWCQDPTEALKMAIELKPTVILQDLIMPEIDGLTLVKYFKTHKDTKNIPLVVLSVKEDPLIKARAFAEGANDYMVKLPEKEEFIARIRYHSKAYIAHLERNFAFDRLAESQRALKKEIDDASDYVRSILPLPLKDKSLTASWQFIPSMTLGGDIFGYHYIDEDHFALYLLDVCGHGVGAALLSISAVNVLREKAASIGFDYYNPSDVLMRMNALFPMEKHHNMFFSMWYGVYTLSSGTLLYSSAGHPPAIIKSRAVGSPPIFEQLTTPGLMIGAMPTFSYTNALFEVKGPARLYLFSDGVFEQELKSGFTTTLDDFVKFLKALPVQSTDEDLDNILRFSLADKKAPSFADDFSIVALDIK